MIRSVGVRAERPTEIVPGIRDVRHRVIRFLEPPLIKVFSVKPKVSLLTPIFQFVLNFKNPLTMRKFLFSKNSLTSTRDLAKKEAPGGGGMTGLINEPGGPSCGCAEGWTMNGLGSPPRGPPLSWEARNRLSSSLRSQSLWGEDSGSIVVGPLCKQNKKFTECVRDFKRSKMVIFRSLLITFF